MTDEAYQRFLDSMVMNFDMWHDGYGYDLELLEQLGDEERSSVEALLIRNLSEAGDWRDVEALVALGTPSARKAVEEARHHRKAKVRNYAIRVLLHDPDPELEAELEELVIQAVAQGYYDMAEHLPTQRVKQALLDFAREGERTTRGLAAAMLLYLCGQAPEPYDWSQRPFFLRFAEGGPEAIRAAWEELRQRVGL